MFEEGIVPFLLKNGRDYLLDLGMDKVVEKLSPNPIDAAYDKALKRWCKNEDIRARYAVFKYSHFEDFRKYLENGPEVCCEEIRSLCALLEEELKKDPKTYSFIADIRSKSIQKSQTEIGNALETIRFNNELHEVESMRRHEEAIWWFNKINDSIKNQRKLEPTNENSFVMPVDYIERDCSFVYNEQSYLDKYLHPEKYPEYKLIDFVLGVRNKENKHILLIGDAQSGKTTELVNLLHKLNASGLLRVFYQEIKGWRFSLPDLSELEQRETVVIIDALDERFNDEERNTLFHCINTFAKRHPFLRMVVSCRSNFKEISYLNEFTQLQLLDLDWEESKQIIKSKCDEADRLISEIEEKRLYDLTRTPLFLLTLIDCYQQKKQIPDKKYELYDYIINRQLEKEEDKGVGSHSCMIDAGKIALESMAIGMQLLERNVVSEYELLKLFDDKTQWIRIQRSGLIEANKDGYSFSHNSFKEHLLSLFLKRMNSIGEIQQFCCYCREKLIKPTWYNVMVLYLSQLSSEDKLFSELIEWLERDNEEMLLYVEPQLIDEDKRGAIFIGILEECKRKGIIYGVRNENLLKALMSFGFGEKSFNYIVGELTKISGYDTHVSNLLRCIQFINWSFLHVENCQLESELKTEVFCVFDRFCANPKAWAIWEPFENPYFYNRNTGDRLLSSISSSEHPRTLNSFIRYVYYAGMSSDYIDFILDKCKFVHDYVDEGVTCMVYPGEINESLKCVDSREGVEKVLAFLENGIKNRETRSEFVIKHKGVIDSVIVKAEKVVSETALSNILIRIFEEGVDLISSYGEVYDFNKPIVDYLNNHGHGEQLFYKYTSKIVEGFHQNDLSPHKYSKCAAYFVTPERFEIFALEHMNTEIGFISVRCLNSYLFDVKVDYIRIINEYYPDFVNCLVDRVDIKKRNDLECLFNYEQFRKEILLLLDENPENRMELSKRLYNYDGVEDRLNKHVYAFFNEFANGKGFEFERIKEFIENKDFYNWFLLHETIGCLLSNSDEVSDSQRQIVVDIAKDFIDRFINGEAELKNLYLYYPIELLMKGFIKIDESVLMKLLPYSSDFTIDNITLFEFIVDQPGIKTQKIMDFIMSKIKSGEKVHEYTLILWASFIIRNKIESAYSMVIDWAVQDPWDRIIPMIIEEPSISRMLLIRNVFDRFSVSKKLDILWELIVKKDNNTTWIKQELESLFDALEDEKDRIVATKMLLMLGSMVGLQYVTNHLEYFGKDGMLPNYDNEEALPFLFNALDYLLERKNGLEGARLHEAKTCVISSIGKIASSSQELFSSIVKKIDGLVMSDKDKYSELNYYVSQWRESLYSNNSKEWTIEEVKEVLKTYRIAS